MAERVDTGLAWEYSGARAILEDFGATADQLHRPDGIGTSLRPERWWPDYRCQAGDAGFLVDAKTRVSKNANTPNHSVELRSLIGSLHAADTLALPAYFLCHDGLLMPAPELAEIAWGHRSVQSCCRSCLVTLRSAASLTDACEQLPAYCPRLLAKRNKERGDGSDTPYFLFPRERCQHLSVVHARCRSCPFSLPLSLARAGWRHHLTCGERIWSPILSE